MPMKSRSAILTIVSLIALLAVAVAVSGCQTNTAASTWESPNQNSDNTRYVGGRITKDSVEKLGIAWTAELDAKGSFGAMATQPIIDANRVYVQDLESNVAAYNLTTGKKEWEKKFDEANVGPNGVALEDGKIYGATTSKAFALDADTGKEIWTNTSLVPGLDKGGIGFTIAPQVADGVVHISTAAMIGGGIAYALDAKTGKKIWEWDSVIDKVADKVQGPGVGGSWNAPLVGDDNSVYWGIGNPYTSIKEGIENPSEGLYLDSTVKLDAKTGKLDWHYQGVPNDFYDWDMHLSPIAAKIDDRDVILDGGKMGYVYAYDAKDGKLIWKKAVGKHNGHDDDPKLALEGKFKPKTPYTVYPGTLGGIETNMAYADETIYAPVSNLSYTHKDIASTDVFEGLQDYDKGDGQMVALDVKTGDIKWDTKLPSMVYGAATAVNDLVFTTTYDGHLFALDRDNGEIVFQDKLPAGANSPIAVSDDTVIVPAGVAQGKDKPASLIAYTIGGVGITGEAAAEEAPEPAEEVPAEEGGRMNEGGGKPGDESSAGDEAVTEGLDGKSLFTDNCAGCHTLADAGAKGTVGPNLDAAKPDVKAAIDKITKGGGGMPAFAGTLTEEEIQAIAEYVASAAGG
ncbi:MAG: PQQ-binding-like beta-propeller repeat protein [Solirubrobacterales bacterium]